MSASKGKHWYNNGITENYFEECPEGWIRGRLPIKEETRKKMSENSAYKNMSEEWKNQRNAKIAETKQNLSLDQKKELSEKISNNRKGKGLGQAPWNKGLKGAQEAWNKGMACTEERKQKISDTRKNKSEEEILQTSFKLSNSLKGRIPRNKDKPAGAWTKNEENKDLIKNYLQKCLNTPFPQTTLNKLSLNRNFNTLQKTNNPISNCCMQLIQHFHPSIWKCNKKGYKSPIEAWQDVNCLVRAINNRLKYKGEDLTPKDIRRAFSIAKIAPKVSVFKPSLAKYLILKYLDNYNQIFDPCSGFSGRLLASASLGKNYIGQDINCKTVKESNNLIQELKIKNCEIACKNSLCTTGNYECLFTCPPYSDKENWNQDVEVLDCDEWITTCLNNYKCKKYLFVVDNTDKYKEFIVETVFNKSHFGETKEFVLLLTNEDKEKLLGD